LRLHDQRAPCTGTPPENAEQSRVRTITISAPQQVHRIGARSFILAIVEFIDAQTHKVHYLRQPFSREPDFGVTSVNYDFADLLARAEAPQ